MRFYAKIIADIVHDGTIIKAKIVVRKILLTTSRTPEGYPASYGLDSVNAITAIVPPPLHGQPSQEPWNPQKDLGTEMKFEEQEVKIQEYTATNGFRITVKPVITKIFRYNKINDFGEPVYNALIQAIINIEKIATTAA